MRGAYRPFGGAPFSDDPMLVTERLTWPLFYAPLLGTVLMYGLVVFDQIPLLRGNALDAFICSALFAFVISLGGLARGTSYRALARIGLSLLAAGLTIPLTLLAFFIWLYAACDGGACLG